MSKNVELFLKIFTGALVAGLILALVTKGNAAGGESSAQGEPPLPGAAGRTLTVRVVRTKPKPKPEPIPASAPTPDDGAAIEQPGSE